MNDIAMDEGRLDVSSGALRFSPAGPDSIEEVLSEYAAVVPSAFTRRQHREGRISLLSRIDRIFCSLPTGVLRKLRATGANVRSIFDPTLPSDHSPIEFTLHATCRRRGARIPPSWVASHPLFISRLQDTYSSSEWFGMTAFDALSTRTDVMHIVALEVARQAREPGPSHRPDWVRHWIGAARTAWGRGRVDEVRDCLLRVPDASGLFLQDDGSLRPTVSDADLAERLGQANREAVVEDMAREVLRADGAEAKASIRARANRKLASWSPSRRRILTQVVVDADGNTAESAEAAEGLMFDDWGPIFSDDTPIDLAASEWLQQWVGDIALPDLETFTRMVHRTASSALGPDVLSYAFWHSHPDNVKCLYTCLQAICDGQDPPAWFNSSAVIFTPKATPSPTDSDCLAPPSRYRPLTLANASQKLVAKALNYILEGVASSTVSPLQRGFAKGRQIMDNVFDVEASMEVCLHREGCDPGIFLFDVEAAFPSASQEWIWQVLRHMGLPLPSRRAIRALYSDVSVHFLLNGQLSKRSVCVTSGIKQRCPSSGSLWALLYDPVVRALASVSPPR